MDELGQVTSHSGLKTERNFKALVIIQHHRAVQPHTAISWLARALSRPQTARTPCHSACKKQIPLLWLSVAVIFDSAFIKRCVCVIKSNFLSWAIRPVFTDSVTYDSTLGKEMVYRYQVHNNE